LDICLSFELGSSSKSQGIKGVRLTPWNDPRNDIDGEWS
jgi:hypothetical protein